MADISKFSSNKALATTPTDQVAELLAAGWPPFEIAKTMAAEVERLRAALRGIRDTAQAADAIRLARTALGEDNYTPLWDGDGSELSEVGAAPDGEGVHPLATVPSSEPSDDALDLAVADHLQAEMGALIETRLAGDRGSGPDDA